MSASTHSPGLPRAREDAQRQSHAAHGLCCSQQGLCVHSSSQQFTAERRSDGAGRGARAGAYSSGAVGSGPATHLPSACPPLSLVAWACGWGSERWNWLAYYHLLPAVLLPLYLPRARREPLAPRAQRRRPTREHAKRQRRASPVHSCRRCEAAAAALRSQRRADPKSDGRREDAPIVHGELAGSWRSRGEAAVTTVQLAGSWRWSRGDRLFLAHSPL